MNAPTRLVIYVTVLAIPFGTLWFASSSVQNAHGDFLAQSLYFLTIFAGIAATLILGRMIGYLNAFEGAASSPGTPGRNDYEELRSEVETGGTFTEIYNGLILRLLIWADRFFGDTSGAAGLNPPPASGWMRRIGFQLDYPTWTVAAYDRCLLLAVVYPLLVILLGWVFGNEPGVAGAMLGLHSTFWIYRLILVVSIFVQSSMAYFVAQSMIRSGDWQNDGSSLGERFSRFRSRLSEEVTQEQKDKMSPLSRDFWKEKLHWAIFVLMALLTINFGSFVGFYLDATILLMVFNFSAGIRTNGLCLLVLIVTGATVLFGTNQKEIGGLTLISDAYAGGATRNGGGPGGIAIVFSIALSLGFAYFITVTKILGRLKQFYLLSTILLAEACFAFAVWIPFAGPIILYVPIFALVNGPFDWFSLGVTRLLLRWGLERQGPWPVLLSLLDAVVAVLMLFVLVGVLVVFAQGFDFVAMHHGAQAPILPLDDFFNHLDVNQWQWEYFWVYGLLITSLIPSIVNCMIGSFSLVRMLPGLRRWVLARMPERGPVADQHHMTVAFTLAAQWTLGILGGLVLSWLIFYELVWQLVLPACDAELLTWARTVAGWDVAGWIASWF